MRAFSVQRPQGPCPHGRGWHGRPARGWASPGRFTNRSAGFPVEVLSAARATQGLTQSSRRGLVASALKVLTSMEAAERESPPGWSGTGESPTVPGSSASRKVGENNKDEKEVCFE